MEFALENPATSRTHSNNASMLTTDNSRYQHTDRCSASYRNSVITDEETHCKGNDHNDS